MERLREILVLWKYTRKKHFWESSDLSENIKKVNYFYMNTVYSLSSYLHEYSQILPQFSPCTSSISKHPFTHNEIGIRPLIFTFYFYHLCTSPVFYYQENFPSANISLLPPFQNVEVNLVSEKYMSLGSCLENKVK